jgi:hypothetical protein
MKLAKFEITFELLKSALGLPENVEILGIAQAGEFQWERSAMLLVTEPSLPVPDHREGEVIRSICPLWRDRKRPKLVNWGI